MRRKNEPPAKSAVGFQSNKSEDPIRGGASVSNVYGLHRIERRDRVSPSHARRVHDSGQFRRRVCPANGSCPIQRRDLREERRDQPPKQSQRQPMSYKVQENESAARPPDVSDQRRQLVLRE